MKNTILFLAAMLVLFTGCNQYDDDIASIQDRLDKIEGSSLTTVEQQITAINGSINDLKTVDAELKSLIASLEGSENEQASFLAELKAKDAELEKTIAALQAYVDGGMDDMEGWANATFATLEQYADVQMWIEALKVAISNQEKWNDETDQLIGMLIEDLQATIEACETSMKEWVNGVLADGYYDIAEIDAQLNALET